MRITTIRNDDLVFERWITSSTEAISEWGPKHEAPREAILTFGDVTVHMPAAEYALFLRIGVEKLAAMWRAETPPAGQTVGPRQAEIEDAAGPAIMLAVREVIAPYPL